MSFSPDGRHLACTLSQEADSENGDVFLLATDGSREVSVIEHPADDNVLGWTPDGKRLVFASDRTGARYAYSIPIDEGRPQGAATILTQLGEFEPMGFTQEGSFYLYRDLPGENVYTATLDMDTGEVLTPPEKAIRQREGRQTVPRWSADGKHLACRDNSPGQGYLIRSMENGDVRQVTPKFKGRGWLHRRILRWAPDGRSFLVGGGGNEGGPGLLQVDVNTGEVTTLVAGRIFTADWSPDGKAVFYKLSPEGEKTRQLIRRDIGSSHETVLCRLKDFGRLTVSPNGRDLAFVTRGEGSGPTSLNVVSAQGGEPRKLIERNGISHLSLAWTHDGRHLLFVMSSDGESELWRIAVDGGAPEKLAAFKGVRTLAHLDIHPDGRQIAFHNSTSKAEILAIDNLLSLPRPSTGEADQNQLPSN